MSERLTRFYVMCPKCAKTSEIVCTTAQPPAVNCGDCLVQMKVMGSKAFRE
jgi:hypothetical protein